MNRRNLLRTVLLLGTIVGPGLLLACAPSLASAPATATRAPLTPVTVVMGYIPNVQFAPFYVAEEKGYFADEGLQINYNWGFEFDGIKLVGNNNADFALATGDQVLQARAQNIPVTYVGNYYNAYPIEVVSFADKGIQKPQDLVGKKVGLPALFGASYTAWRALLAAAGIQEQAVNVSNIGFTQAQALQNNAVDAAVVYANNEPVQLRASGKPLNEIKTWQVAKLVGNGVIANPRTVRERAQVVRGFMRALLRGIQDTINNPDEALQITVKHLPEAGGDNLATSKAVLAATIPLFQNSKLGESRLADWQAMEQFMKNAGFITTDVDVNQVFTNDFIQ